MFLESQKQKLMLIRIFYHAFPSKNKYQRKKKESCFRETCFTTSSGFATETSFFERIETRNEKRTLTSLKFKDLQRNIYTGQ